MRSRIKLTALLVSLFLGAFQALPSTLAAGVVGTGTAGSCTRAALQTAINSGNGLITFNCGGAATIAIDSTLNVDAQTGAKNIIIDGGNVITLDGQDTTRIFLQNTWGNNGSTLTLQNITLTRGYAAGVGTAANGAAINSINQSIEQLQQPILNIDNVTFSNNRVSLISAPPPTSAGDYGGAIYSSGGFVNVTDSTFSGNLGNLGIGSSGAAIHILQSGLSVDNSTFSNNMVTSQGGAIYIDGLNGASGQFSLTNSSFSGNRSHFSGGAIYVNMYENTSRFTVDRTSFINNGVNGGDRAQGGAIAGGSSSYNASTGNAIITINRSLFSQNFVDLGVAGDGSGGAINFNQRAQITIANSTFDSNRAEGESYGANGGAIVIINNTTQFQIINSTITSNFAGWVGGGIASSTNGRLRNTIIAYNSAENGPNDWHIGQQCSSALVNDGTNLQFPPRNPNPNFGNESTCFVGKTAIGQMTLPDYADPKLNPLANNGGNTQTRAPMPDSPALDKGNAATCAAAPVSNLDQRGEPRPVDGDGLNGAQCDIGAHEFVSTSPPGIPSLIAPADNPGTLNAPPTFTWGQAPFATSYRVLVDDDADFSSPVVDQTTTALSFTPAYLGIGTFRWKVIAININGNSESAVRTFIMGSDNVAAPSLNLTIATNQTLTWNRVTWALGYQVEIARDAAFTTIVDTSPTLSPTTFSYTVSLPLGTYYWRVKAMPSEGVWGTPSTAEMLIVGSSS